MIEFDDARNIVLSSAKTLSDEQAGLNESLGRILSRDIHSDINMPPFDKSAMDGYACRREDLNNNLSVIEIIQAGKIPGKKIYKNQCSKIMTGAKVPEGADCVVMIENVLPNADNTIKINKHDSRNNICYQGEDVKISDLLLSKGILIRPQEIAVLSSAGIDKPYVYKQPKVGVIATGNELQEPGSVLKYGNIRNSNSYQLCSQIMQMGIKPKYYGIAKDTESDLSLIIKKAADENDCLIISGGVSMGDFDLVPHSLTKNGFKLLFQKVNIKPGKPLVFGISESSFCFGLPGNPISTFTLFEFVIKEFLYKLMGHDYKPLCFKAKLKKTILRKQDNRRYIFPVIVFQDCTAIPADYHGSAHINALTSANGLSVMEKEQNEISEGSYIDVRQI